MYKYKRLLFATPVFAIAFARLKTNYYSCSTGSARAMGKLDGKVAIVTASTEGIGFAIAQRLGHDGAHVVISSRKQKNVDTALSKLKAENLSVSGMVCHVAQADHRTRLITQTVQDYGGVDILVSNAGISPHYGPMLEISEAAYDKLFELNVKAGFMLTKEIVPHLRSRGGGSIIFVASIAGYSPMPLISTYSVTKTTLLGMTKALAQALADDKIRVNAIAPGIIETKFSGALTETGGLMEDGTIVPLRRVGQPSECSGAVSFLVSEDASYVTGETIVIAGGMTSHL